MCFKRVARFLIINLEEGKQQRNEKAENNMDCAGGTEFLLTATNKRRTWNHLRYNISGGVLEERAEENYVNIHDIPFSDNRFGFV